MKVIDLMDMTTDDFAKLGCGSLERISSSYFKTQKNDYSMMDYELDDAMFFEIDTVVKNKLIRLRQINEETTVFGIDTSNIVLGDTGEGILCAVRGSVVWREKKTYQYVRHGPFIFNINEQNKFTLYNTLRQTFLNADGSTVAPILERIIEQIRFILERWLQRQLCETTQDSLILWDGSMTTRTVNRPFTILEKLLQTARKNHNCILAFSKKTKLSVSGRRLNDLINDSVAPCILDIDKALQSQYNSRLCFFGRMYATKLSPSPFTFRLDIDRRIPEEERLKALGQLLGNELLKDSYPETLRLAHVLSRFSASEVLAMQRYVAKNYGLRIDYRPDIRQVLFGPYGGSNDMWMNSHDASL